MQSKRWTAIWPKHTCTDIADFAEILVKFAEYGFPHRCAVIDKLTRLTSAMACHAGCWPSNLLQIVASIFSPFCRDEHRPSSVPKIPLGPALTSCSQCCAQSQKVKAISERFTATFDKSLNVAPYCAPLTSQSELGITMRPKLARLESEPSFSFNIWAEQHCMGLWYLSTANLAPTSSAMQPDFGRKNRHHFQYASVDTQQQSCSGGNIYYD